MDQIMRQKLRALLVKHEGERHTIYKDIFNKDTIGIGRNLTDKGISTSEIDYLFNNDIDFFYEYLSKYTWFHQLNDARQCAIVDLCFNIGTKRFESFEQMIHGLENNDFEKVSHELLNSHYAQEVGQRAHDLADILLTGELKI